MYEYCLAVITVAYVENRSEKKNRNLAFNCNGKTWWSFEL
jgi:hypothetical protein